MLSVWILLAAAICGVSMSALSLRRIVHGRQLTLDLPERTKKLEFASADESVEYIIWEQKTFSFLPGKATKGQVKSTNNGWTFKIEHVTFDDEGTYTLRNNFGSTISSYSIKVDTNNETIERIAGETLTIPLAGVSKSNFTFRFYGNYSSATLVKNGDPVGKKHPDYINRLKVTSDTIQVLNVNTSDLGRYELTDHKGRLASNNTMILVDHHSYAPSVGLIALLLLGIPGGICFCCRRRICNGCRTTKSYTSTAQSNNPNLVPMSVPCSNPVNYPAGPVGPGQDYNAGYPPHPDQGQIHYPPPPQWNGQPTVPPNPVYNAGYPPQPDQGQIHYPLPQEWNGQPTVPPNPAFGPGYVPANPAFPPEFGPGVPPAQPPQWNAPPTQYNPSAPVNYTPVMNSSPPGPETTGKNMNDMPPSVPLLTPQPEAHQSSLGGISTDILNSSDSGVQFDINKGKSSSSNFL